MIDYFTQVAVGLTLLIFGLIYWTFKPYIDSKTHLSISIPRRNNSVIEISTPKINDIQHDAKSSPQPSIKQGIQHYEKRSELPFDEVVSKAETKIEMSAVTFRITTLNNYKTLRGLLSRKVSITFLLLKADSKVDQSMLYHGSEDLNEQITKSLKELCKLKREFGDLIDIRLYDSLSEHSIVVIDRDDADKAWIQVELHVIGSDPNSRPINVAYEKDNQAFFYQYSKEYNKLFNDSEPYQCPSP